MKKLFVLLLLLTYASATIVEVDFPLATQGDIRQVVNLNQLPPSPTAFDAFDFVANLEYDDYGAMGKFITKINGFGNAYDTSGGEYWSFYVDGQYSQVGVDAYELTGSETVTMKYYIPATTNRTFVDVYPSVVKNVLVNGNNVGQTGQQLKLALAVGTYNVVVGKDSFTLAVSATRTDETRTVYSTTASEAIKWLLDNTKQDGEVGNHKVWGNSFALMALADAGAGATQPKNYLINNQNNDNGWGYPGFGSDGTHTAAVLLGLAWANQQNLNGINYLQSKQAGDKGFASVSGSDTDTTAWAVMALQAHGIDSDGRDYLVNTQKQDGSWGYQSGQQSNLDYTCEAVIALAADGIANQKGVDYIKSQQQPNECWGNAWTSALAIAALRMNNENIGVSCLENMQLPDGGFNRNGGTTSNAPDSAIAALVLRGKSIAFNAENHIGGLFFDRCNNGRGYSLEGLTGNSPYAGHERYCSTGKVDCCGWYQHTHVHDLGEDLDKADLDVVWRPGFSHGMRGTMTVKVSSDNSNWRTAYSTQTTSIDLDGNPAWPQVWKTYSHTVEDVSNVRYVRIEIPYLYNDYSSVSAVENSERTRSYEPEEGPESKSEETGEPDYNWLVYKGDSEKKYVLASHEGFNLWW